MTDIDVRISLVEQNYQNLEKRIDKVEEKLDDIKEQMMSSQTQITKVIIGAAGTVVASILSIVVVMLMNQ